MFSNNQRLKQKNRKRKKQKKEGSHWADPERTSPAAAEPAHLSP
jgi:hypothetical protein